MAKCTAPVLPFPRCQRHQVQAEFTGGDITSDGGVLLLRQVDKRLGLLAAVDRVLPDPRDPRLIAHSQLSLLRQRVYGLCLGYEDLNNHTTLRTDVALQTALERTATLASAATLCRLENRADRQVMWRLHEVLVEQFIASFDTPPTELIVDVDATDDPVHGRQEQRFFHGYYDHILFSAAVCVLRRSAVSQLLTPWQHRWRQACLGHFSVVGQTVTPRLAAGTDSGTSRQWVLSLADAVLVWAPGSPIPYRFSEECSLESVGGAVPGTGGEGLCRHRPGAAVLCGDRVWRGELGSLPTGAD